MMSRLELVKREAEGLWMALYGEVPIVDAEGALLLDVLIRSTHIPVYQAQPAANELRPAMAPPPPIAAPSQDRGAQSGNPVQKSHNAKPAPGN